MLPQVLQQMHDDVIGTDQQHETLESAWAQSVVLQYLGWLAGGCWCSMRHRDLQLLRSNSMGAAGAQSYGVLDFVATPREMDGAAFVCEVSTTRSY